jgi:hypothetical protein
MKPLPEDTERLVVLTAGSGLRPCCAGVRLWATPGNGALARGKTDPCMGVPHAWPV